MSIVKDTGTEACTVMQTQVGPTGWPVGGPMTEAPSRVSRCHRPRHETVPVPRSLEGGGRRPSRAERTGRSILRLPLSGSGRGRSRPSPFKLTDEPGPRAALPFEGVSLVASSLLKLSRHLVRLYFTAPTCQAF